MNLRLAVCLTCLSLAAQDAAVFTTDVKVVNVLATVRTKKGELVRDLTKDDFTLLENNRPQAIRYFSRETDLPLTIGLMVDTSMSQHRVLEQERAASFRFFDQVLRPEKDHVFIIQFDMAVMLRQALTASRRELEQTLSLVDTPTLNELQMQRGAGTLLYDAVVKASNDLMRAQKGRKALILLTDGVDTGSEASSLDAIEAAQRADTLIYSILFSDETYYGGGLPFGHPDGASVLMRMSKETGGSYYAVSKKLGIEKIFAAIQDELRSQFNIGYVSDLPVRISEFRKIQLTVKQKGFVVEARNKYWAQR